MQSLQTGGPQSRDSDKLILVTNMIRTQTTKQNSFVKKFLFNFETPSKFKSLPSYSSTLRFRKSNVGFYFFSNKIKVFEVFPDTLAWHSAVVSISASSVFTSRGRTPERITILSPVRRREIFSDPSPRPPAAVGAVVTPSAPEVS